MNQRKLLKLQASNLEFKFQHTKMKYPGVEQPLKYFIQKNNSAEKKNEQHEIEILYPIKALK